MKQKAVILGGLLALLGCLAPISAQLQSPIATKPHRNVCMMPYTTIDICGTTNGTLDGYTGYEAEASGFHLTSVQRRLLLPKSSQNDIHSMQGHCNICKSCMRRDEPIAHFHAHAVHSHSCSSFPCTSVISHAWQRSLHGAPCLTFTHSAQSSPSGDATLSITLPSIHPLLGRTKCLAPYASHSQ